MRAAQEQELESLREQLEGVNRSMEEVEADMKTLGISLMQVRSWIRNRALSRVRGQQVSAGFVYV